MSNFNPNFKTTFLTIAALGCTGTALAQEDTNRAVDAFNIADSNGDRTLDRAEFPTFISFLASGTTSGTAIASNATDYDIPFANKDKNGDGSLSPAELKIVVGDASPYGAPATSDVEPATVQSYEQAPAPELVADPVSEPVIDTPIVDVPIDDPALAAPVAEPVIEAPMVEEPTLEEPMIEEPIVEPLGEDTEPETLDPENQG